MKPLSQLLGTWTPLEGGAAADPVVLLAAGWREIVGDQIARNSCPSRIVDDTLSIVARSSSWSHELSFLAPRIVAAVRARFPKTAVRRLRFRVGAVPAPRHRPAPAPPGARAAAPHRPADPAPPDGRAPDALARFRAGVEERRRAKSARGWNECKACAALIAPGDGALCITCANAGAQGRTAAVARLLFEAPWLGYDAIAELVDGLDRREYASIRATLLSRWWEALSKAAAAKRLSRDGRERSIASSYLLLKSGLPPEDVRPATVRSVLGDELHDFIYGTETQAKTNVEQ